MYNTSCPKLLSKSYISIFYLKCKVFLYFTKKYVNFHKKALPCFVKINNNKFLFLSKKAGICYPVVCKSTFTIYAINPFIFL